MPLIATCIEPTGVARMFFDMRPAAPQPDDEARIIQAIEKAQAAKDSPSSLKGN